MDEYKSLNKYLNKRSGINNKDNLSFFIKSFISKILIASILFILFLIGNKSSDKFSSLIFNNVYKSSFSFAAFNSWYSEKFGTLFPIDSLFEDTQTVFNEKLIYDSANLYKEGVALKVSSNYLVPVLSNGIVVFIGNNEEYGNTLIVQQDDGINVWYSNINVSDLSMYDYVDKGAFLGAVNGDTLYLVFEKDGEFLDYKKYI